MVVCIPTPTGDKAVAASAYMDENGQFSLQALPPDNGAVPGDERLRPPTLKQSALAANWMRIEDSVDCSEPVARVPNNRECPYPPFIVRP